MISTMKTSHLKKEIEKDNRNWKATLCSWISFNIVIGVGGPYVYVLLLLVNE